jgi:hypothetical protein
MLENMTGVDESECVIDKRQSLCRIAYIVDVTAEHEVECLETGYALRTGTYLQHPMFAIGISPEIDPSPHIGDRT